MYIKYLLLLVIAMPSIAIADSYKCKLPNGTTEIRDSPCVGSGKTVATVSTYQDVASERSRVAAANRENQRQLEWASGRAEVRHSENQAIRENQMRQDRAEEQQRASAQAAADRQAANLAEAQRQQKLDKDISDIKAAQASAANAANNSKRGPMSCYQAGSRMICN
jgi:hypothetical protein